MALSTQRCLHLCIDAAGNVLRGGIGISWQDARCAEQVEWMRSAIGAERYYEITGLPLSTIWAAPEIRWMQEHEPDVYAATDKILTTQEYLASSYRWFRDTIG